MKENRVAQIDIIKALCIIPIVFGHAAHSILWFDYFYIFGFYFISGVTFKMKPFKDFFISKVKRIYFPFVFANLLAFFFSLILSKYTSYINSFNNWHYFIHIILFDLRELIMAPCWFLLPLFFIVFIMFFIIKYIKNDKIILFIGILSIILALLFEKVLNTVMWNNCAVISNVMIGLFVTILGYLYNKYLKERIKYNKKFCIDIFVLSIIVLCEVKYYQIYLFDLRDCTTNNIFYMVITMFSGLYFLIYFSDLLCESFFLKRILSYVGEHSMSIMFFHIIGFNILTLIGVVFFRVTYTPSWNNGIYNGIISIINPFFGIVFPLLFDYILKMIKMSFEIRKK